MKKILSVLLALAMIATMISIQSVFAFASEPSITMSTDTVVVDRNGNFEPFSVTVTGATTYQSWIGIYKASVPQYSGYSERHWCYLWGGRDEYPQASMLPNEIVKDGLVYELTRDDLNPAHDNNLSTGDYIMVLFDNDGATGPAGAKDYSQADGYVEIARCTFKVVSETTPVYATQNAPGHTTPTYWLNIDNGEFATEFYASQPFIGVDLVAWSSKPTTALFEFYKGSELVYSTYEYIQESASNPVYFKDAEGNEIQLEKGQYTWVISVPDEEDLPEGMTQEEAAYLVVPTAPINPALEELVLCTFNGSDVEGADGLEAICAKFIVKTSEAIDAVKFFSIDPADITPTPDPTPTSAPTEAPTEAPTAEPTAAPTEAPTEAPTSAPTPAKSGCGSIISGSIAFFLAAGAVLLLRKKH